jgi:hypothetical protein
MSETVPVPCTLYNRQLFHFCNLLHIGGTGETTGRISTRWILENPVILYPLEKSLKKLYRYPYIVWLICPRPPRFLAGLRYTDFRRIGSDTLTWCKNGHSVQVVPILLHLVQVVPFLLHPVILRPLSPAYRPSECSLTRLPPQ